MNYKQLNKLSPEEFLNPFKFKTEWDKQHEGTSYPIKQYQTGLKYANEFETVGICANGTWFAANNDKGSHVTSYEGIGYHACTCDLLRGLLDGKAKFVVYRYTGKRTIKTVIKEAK